MKPEYINFEQIRGKITQTLEAIYEKIKDKTAKTDSVPAGPDTSKFRATRYGFIEMESDFSVSGEYFPIYFTDALKIGSNAKVSVASLKEELEQLYDKLLSKYGTQTKYDKQLIVNYGGQLGYIKVKNIYGTAWSAIGFSFSPITNIEKIKGEIIMAKKISEIVPLIKEMKEDYSISLDGNWHGVKKEDIEEMTNDHYMHLGDKEFIDKWNKKGYSLHPRGDYDEASDNYDELDFPLSYFIVTNDGGEVAIDFWDWRESESNVEILEESPEAKEIYGVANSKEWDIDIDELYKRVNKGVEASQGGSNPPLSKMAKKVKGGLIKQVMASERGVVKNVIKLLQQYNQTEQGSPKALKIYENLKAMGYTGSESDLGIQAQYWGECEIVSPSYIVNNHDRSSWMHILTNDQDVARDYKAVFKVEQYGGWDGDRKDYIQDLIEGERLSQLKITPRQVWTWAKESNITEKNFNTVLEMYADVHKEELESLIDEDKFNNWINEWLAMSYSDIDMNYGKIGEGSDGIFIDAYGSRNMPSTADRLADNEIISGITVDKAYIVEGDGFAKRLYYNMKSI